MADQFDTPAAPSAETLAEDTRDKVEAAAFRRLLAHLRERSDVQNIDLMNLAGFCRNCLANWLREAAEGDGVAMTKDAARERVYAMPYKEWQKRFQREATPEAAARFAASAPDPH